MASHEHDHDEEDASRAGDHGNEEPVGTGESVSHGPGPGDAHEELRAPSAPVEAADPATYGEPEPTSPEPSPPAVTGPADAVAPESVVPPADGHVERVTSEGAGLDPAGPAAGQYEEPADLGPYGPADPATNGPAEVEGNVPADLGGDVPPDLATNGPADLATNGPADPEGDVPADLEGGVAADLEGDAVAAGQRAPGSGGSRAPGDARRPTGRPAGGGRPPGRGRPGGSSAGRRAGPPRNRRPPSASGRATMPRPTAPSDGDEDRPAPRPAGRKGMVILLSCLSVLAVVLTIVAVNLGRSADRKAAPPATTTATTRPLATLPDAAFTTFRDDETGFTIRHPSSWERLAVPLREIRLFVSDGGAFSVQVRVRRTEQATTPENLGNLRSFTDGSVAHEGVQVLKVDPVTINGLIGYRYLYTFVDENSGIQGAHLHYFLFQGHKMNAIVFQALPTEEFTKAEGVFNQMLDSFRSDPEPAGGPPPASPVPSPPGG